MYLIPDTWYLIPGTVLFTPKSMKIPLKDACTIENSHSSNTMTIVSMH